MNESHLKLDAIIYSIGTKDDSASGSQDTNEEIVFKKVSRQYFKKVSRRYIWSGGLGLLLALGNSCFIYCLWPQSHIFLVPNAWHEFMTTAAIGFIALFSGSLILNCEVWMNIKEIKSWRNFWFLYMSCAVAWIFSNVGYYHIYNVMLGLHPPMPLNIHVCGILTYVAAFSILWFIIPSSVRKSEKNFWKRYGFYVSAQTFRYVAVLEYFACTWGFFKLGIKYQWIVALLLPVIREVNARVLGELCYRCGRSEDITCKVTAAHEMACRHAIFLSVAVSLLATVQTAFICFGLDFLEGLVLCLKIIWRAKKRQHIIDVEYDNDIHELVCNAKTVTIIPLAYFFCFLVAWFGPNYWIIGSVGNASWHWGRVEKLGPPLSMLLAMIALELIGIIVYSLLLQFLVQISYFDGYIHMQKKYWLIMAVHEAYALNEVRKINFYSYIF